MRAQICLVLLILTGLVAGCEEDAPAPQDPPPVRRDGLEVDPAGTPDPTSGPARPDVAGKPAFDMSRVPARIPGTAPAPARVAGVGTAAPAAPPLPAALAALCDVAPLRGFDVTTFAWGRAPMRTDVTSDGLASLRFAGAGAAPEHIALIRRFDGAGSARRALAARLAGIAGATRPHAVGEAGFALLDSGGRVARVLFVRANLLLEARALGGHDAAALADELDRHAMSAPAGGAGQKAPAITVLGTARAGQPTPVEVRAGGGVVRVHWRASAGSAVDTHGGRAWLLSPQPGARTLTAIVIDRWLRVARVETTVTVGQ